MLYCIFSYWLKCRFLAAIKVQVQVPCLVSVSMSDMWVIFYKYYHRVDGYTIYNIQSATIYMYQCPRQFCSTHMKLFVSTTFLKSSLYCVCVDVLWMWMPAMCAWVCVRMRDAVSLCANEYVYVGLCEWVWGCVLMCAWVCLLVCVRLCPNPIARMSMLICMHAWAYMYLNVCKTRAVCVHELMFECVNEYACFCMYVRELVSICACVWISVLLFNNVCVS
jgi:hypothetical protein